MTTENIPKLNMDYYLYKDSFGEDIKSVPYISDDKGSYIYLPKDIKRLISRGDKTFKTRIYFVSEETRAVYRGYGCGYCLTLSQRPISKRSNSVQIIPDDDGRTTISLSDRFFKRVKDMNELILN